MVEAGRIGLWVAVVGGLGACVAGVRFWRSGPWLLGVAAAGAGLSTFVLGRALATNDFSLAYVASNSRRGATTPYRIAALWGGMAGSLLFFAALLGVVGLVAAARRSLDERARAVVLAISGGLVAAPVGLVLAFADPFSRLDMPTIEGRGLTPILEHPAMLYHPPLLYLGLVTLVAPFVLTIAALATGQDDWAPLVRRWLVVPWTLLAVGMVAGAHWAYVELGWGGYWAWDPVENTALLPWLAVTLALHASLRRPSPVGFAALVCLAFVLALAGTMLTRSGAVPSVHAFGEDVAIGRGLAALLAVVILGSVVVLAKSVQKRTYSRRFRTDFGWWLVAGHLAVVGAVLGIAVVGTATPLVSELSGGDDIAIEGRYFAQFAGPLATVGLLLVALVPAVMAPRGWADSRRLRWLYGLLLGLGLVVGDSALAGGGGDVDPPRLLLGCAAGIALVTALGGGVAAVAARRRVAPHLAHAGIGLLLLGVAGTATGRTEMVPVEPGETIVIRGEAVRYDGVTVAEDDDGRSTVTAEVRTSGRVLRPSLVAYPERRQILPETSLISTLARDIQVGLRDASDDGRATLQIGVYPLQVLVWWGALLVVAAGVLTALEHRVPE